MQIVHNVLLLNALMNVKDKTKCGEIIDNFKDNELNNYFEDYKIFFQNDTIDFIRCFLNIIDILNKEEGTIIIKNIVKFKSYPELAKLFSIIKFGVYLNNNNKSFNNVTFNDYYRVVSHLIDNTDIDTKDNFYLAIESLNSVDELFLEDVYLKLSNLDINERFLPFFNKEQEKEEIIKAFAIMNYEHLADYIKSLEGLDYFKSEILWALKLEGYDFSTYRQFKDKPIYRIDKILMLFDKNGLKYKDKLFKRALLTFGDYSFVDENDSRRKTLFFEGGNQYFNLRRLLREEKSFTVFKKLYDSIDTNKIDEFLQGLINNYNSLSDEFVYYVIKNNKLLEISKENRFIESEDGRIIILHGSRLSGYYDEFHIYCLKLLLDDEGIENEYQSGIGYLDSDSSKCYISRINDQDVVLYYSNKNYNLNGKAYNSISIKGMFEIIKEKYFR